MNESDNNNSSHRISPERKKSQSAIAAVNSFNSTANSSAYLKKQSLPPLSHVRYSDVSDVVMDSAEVGTGSSTTSDDSDEDDGGMWKQVHSPVPQRKSSSYILKPDSLKYMNETTDKKQRRISEISNPFDDDYDTLSLSAVTSDSSHISDTDDAAEAIDPESHKPRSKPVSPERNNKHIMSPDTELVSPYKRSDGGRLSTQEQLYLHRRQMAEQTEKLEQLEKVVANRSSHKTTIEAINSPDCSRKSVVTPTNLVVVPCVVFVILGVSL